MSLAKSREGLAHLVARHLDKALQIRAEGGRVIANLPAVLPTGWNACVPNPCWPLESLRLSAHIRKGEVSA